MMIDRGLMPSHTGKPGGKTTGEAVSHYIIEGGAFQLACRKLLDSGFKLNWESRDYRRVSSKESKAKHTCPQCGQHAWAKPSARLLCGVCHDGTGAIVRMEKAGPEGVRLFGSDLMAEGRHSADRCGDPREPHGS